MAQLDGYIRVSDVHGRSGDSFISPDQQRDKIHAWAKLHDHEIVVMEEELDVSAGKLSRPKLDRIMARIRAGETGGIAIARLDRFSRAGVGDALALIEEIKSCGGIFGCVEPAIDTGDPVMGEFVTTIFLALARMERRRIGANWVDARARATSRGRHMGPRAPFGYRKRPEDGRLEPDPVTKDYAAGVFERRAAGQPWGAISRWLNESLVASLVVFNAGFLRDLVKNEVYLGVLIDRASGTRVENAHPPLVDPLTWQAAQTRRGVRFGDGKPARPRPLLLGIARCASCRYVLARNADDRLQCRHAKDGCCPAPVSIRFSDARRQDYRDGRDGRGLDSYITARLFERLPEIEAEAFGADSEIQDIETAAKVARAELTAHAADLELLQALGREAYLARSESLRAAAESAESAFAEALRQNAGRLQQPLRNLRTDWETMTQDEQRDLLASLIQAVFVRPASTDTPYGVVSLTDVHIAWFDDPAIDLPRQGRRDYILQPFVFPDTHDPDDFGEVAA